ncbi:Bug family tripartite tricarboxylate transporter substrate binding protein [Azohydromonas caseinilytica]|uniref:Tripartite tricarboxylate transporter substrate binding protein n=1 Tax=Azohydromonas caseinilytica TaxID=2728836 RepID=A0A848FBE7_9BURK|nr:tripartite tricarboxylate transporter substrate binding protein [Azohydromonas caseinilytica]NML15769.1 tripartite tricarboxylate transporter substrate binding protein [Azohydromonas caseinilytica]
MTSSHRPRFQPTRRRLLTAALALPAARWVQAQPAWPAKTITLIVPFAPGGIADITARTVTQAVAKSLGQTIVIDNRPSAGSIVASQAVAKAAPDGYTVLLMSNSNAVSEGLFKKLPFSSIRDFAPVATLGFFDLAAFVDNGSRFKSLAEVIGYAKANPGKLTIGTISIGSTQHLAAELFKTTAGIDAVIVPYKASAAVLTALRGGEIDIGFEILGPFLSQVTGKTLRALAVTSDKRFPTLPDVPTVQESGVRNYNVASWNALAVPAKTPQAVIERLNRAANDALKQPEVQQQLQKLGVRPKGGTPQELQTLLASEIKRWSAVIAEAKIERQ